MGVRFVCRRMAESSALGAITMTLRLHSKGSPVPGWPGAGVYWTGIGWGVSCTLSAGPSSPFCSAPVSGCARACRVSACHSCTRSVGVFPAWGSQEDILSLLCLYQEVPSSIPGLPAGGSGQCHRLIYWHRVNRGQGCYLKSLQYTGQSPQQRIMQPHMSIVLLFYYYSHLFLPTSS